LRNLARFAEKQNSLKYLVSLVPGAGIEPARLAAGDFESPASTNFTTRAVTQIRQGSSLNGRRVATRSEIMSEFARLRKRLQQNI
jgi:hypothetical protein